MQTIETGRVGLTCRFIDWQFVQVRRIRVENWGMGRLTCEMGYYGMDQPA